MKYITIATLAGTAVLFAGAASAQQGIDFSKVEITRATSIFRTCTAISEFSPPPPRSYASPSARLRDGNAAPHSTAAVRVRHPLMLAQVLEP
jgi:hypothetical protein